MLTLGIETSGRSAAIALYRGSQPLAERVVPPSGLRHAQGLVPEIRAQLAENGIRPAELELIAVSVGPGSFTGLRIGVVCAKTLAYATGAKLVAVDTFLAIAANSPSEMNEVSVIGDAQRGDLYVGRYRRNDSTWEAVESVRIVAGNEWARARVAGEAVSGAAVDQWDAEFPSGVVIVDSPHREPRPGTIALLGQEMAANGQFANVWGLEPFYLRKSAAEEKWDADHAR